MSSPAGWRGTGLRSDCRPVCVEGLFCVRHLPQELIGLAAQHAAELIERDHSNHGELPLPWTGGYSRRDVQRLLMLVGGRDAPLSGDFADLN